VLGALALVLSEPSEAAGVAVAQAVGLAG
jgi:hypothetical protein